MKYDSYIVSYSRGTSGNFITQILDRLIVGYKPIHYCERNSCHIDQPFTGIAHPNAWNDPKIYEHFEFQNKRIKDYKFSKILTTHIYPDFNVINSRYTNIGIVLIIPSLDDLNVTTFNTEYKIFGKIPDLSKTGHLTMLPDHFTRKSEYPKNCLEIKYKDIFTKTDRSFLALEKIEVFAGLTATQELINDYRIYVENQYRLIEQHKNHLR